MGLASDSYVSGGRGTQYCPQSVGVDSSAVSVHHQLEQIVRSEDVELVAFSETLECLIIAWCRKPNSDHQLNNCCHDNLDT